MYVYAHTDKHTKYVTYNYTSMHAYTCIYTCTYVIIYIYMHVHAYSIISTYVFINYNTGRSTLPEKYTRNPEGECALSGKA